MDIINNKDSKKDPKLDFDLTVIRNPLTKSFWQVIDLSKVNHCNRKDMHTNRTPS